MQHLQGKEGEGRHCLSCSGLYHSRWSPRHQLLSYARQHFRSRYRRLEFCLPNPLASQSSHRGFLSTCANPCPYRRPCRAVEELDYSALEMFGHQLGSSLAFSALVDSRPTSLQQALFVSAVELELAADLFASLPSSLALVRPDCLLMPVASETEAEIAQERHLPEKLRFRTLDFGCGHFV